MSADSKKLLRLFRELTPVRQTALLEYAEFLSSRETVDGANAIAQEPQLIPRPQQESVVKAIQRLMSSYPMLERNKLFQETSVQMTRHVMQGVPANQVIDELEVIFQRQYDAYSAERKFAPPEN
jgi:hypothetical protein